MKILSINRGNEFSPNHISNDAAILKAVSEHLQAKGTDVDIIAENELDKSILSGYDAVVNMCRSNSALALLKGFETEGHIVINSAHGIENCIRFNMTKIFMAHGLKHPESILADNLSTLDIETLTPQYPCWIKRGDACAMTKEDVTYADSKEKLTGTLSNFKKRNIRKAVINRHLTGDLVKFYGVANTGFFYWFYPSPEKHSKFGLEIYNGEAQGIPFSLNELKAECAKASMILNVPIYGGDAVVTANGDFKIIDFNDWPSYARCREEAAVHIAEYISSRIKNCQ